MTFRLAFRRRTFRFVKCINTPKEFVETETIFRLRHDSVLSGGTLNTGFTAYLLHTQARIYVRCDVSNG